MNYSAIANKSIDGYTLTRDECHTILDSPDADILDVLAAAFKVRRTFCGNKVHIHVLMNAKSGFCPEDCGYCSQSIVSTANISKYQLVDEDRLITGAMEAKEAKAKRFCIVASGQ